MTYQDSMEDGAARAVTVLDVLFADRVDAGRRLARQLMQLRGEDVVVVGLPRGGVVVAAEVALTLGAPLDVIVVRKLGVPFQPEVAMGAIGEGGARVINGDVIRAAGIGPEELAGVEVRERAELRRRVERFRGEHDQVPLAGRVVIVVDDGVATGSTAHAACQVVRAQGAARVVLAVPVAPVGWRGRFAGVADELVCLATPRPFVGIGCFYRDFSETSDAEVVAALARARHAPSATAPGAGGADGAGDAPAAPFLGPPAFDPPAFDPPAFDPPAGDDEVSLDVDGVTLEGRLTVPEQIVGVVLFAHGSGSSRHSPRNRLVARQLNGAGLATLLFDLLTPEEGAYRANVFDIGLLAGRLAGATAWLRRRTGFASAPIGWFGASTGAGACLWAAAEPGADAAAVVSRGGRPDLAGGRLALVRTPTLLIVGSQDPVVLDLNREALGRMRCEARLAIVPGATHLFEEPGTLQAAATVAETWFLRHLRRTAGPAGPASSG
jgi:putative phosphoribosyl transferase